MKIFKTILLLGMVKFLAACSVNTTEFKANCIDQFPANERAGISYALQEMKEEVEIRFGEVTRREVKIVGACSMSCKAGYSYNGINPTSFQQANPTLISALEDSSPRGVCVPNAISCISGGFAPLIGMDLNLVFSPIATPMNKTALDAAVYGTCSSECELTGCGPEEPEGCLEGYVLNSETNSCTQEEMECTEDELNGIGAATGYKQFNTFTNEYDLCQAITCQEGYTLGLGICNPDIGGGDDETPVCTPPQQLDVLSNTCQIFGCMDSSAANYNPLATLEDMSCFCTGMLPWDPITGCADMNFPE